MSEQEAQAKAETLDSSMRGMTRTYRIAEVARLLMAEAERDELKAFLSVETEAEHRVRLSHENKQLRDELAAVKVSLSESQTMRGDLKHELDNLKVVYGQLQRENLALRSTLTTEGGE